MLFNKLVFRFCLVIFEFLTVVCPLTCSSGVCSRSLVGGVLSPYFHISATWSVFCTWSRGHVGQSHFPQWGYKFYSEIEYLSLHFKIYLCMPHVCRYEQCLWEMIAPWPKIRVVSGWLVEASAHFLRYTCSSFIYSTGIPTINLTTGGTETDFTCRGFWCLRWFCMGCRMLEYIKVSYTVK